MELNIYLIKKCKIKMTDSKEKENYIVTMIADKYYCGGQDITKAINQVKQQAISSERERIKGIIRKLQDKEGFDEEDTYINSKELLEMIENDKKTTRLD